MTPTGSGRPRRFRFDPLWIAFGTITAAYLLFLLAMLGATALHSSPADLWHALQSDNVRYSIKLSLVTCTVTALFSVLLAVPVGYLLSRARFSGKAVLDAALDIPIVLPPMVVGLCLLILFQTRAVAYLDLGIPRAMHRLGLDVLLTGQPFHENARAFTFTVMGVVLAQFVIGAAFAVRTMRGTFDHLSARPENVAMTLGCSRARAVWLVTLPAARRGMFAAASIAWARSLGEFGPILVFAGATRGKTEVLPTTVWLELTVGSLESAIAVSILMVLLAVLVLASVRVAGERV